MARYRKIDPRMWGDAKFLALPEPTKFFFIYCLSGPHTTNLPGLSNVGAAALAERLGGAWSPKDVRKCLAELEASGMVFHDQMAQVLWSPNAVKYDPPNSIQTVKSWATPWGEIRDCELKSRGYQRLQAYVEGLHPALRQAFADVIQPPKLVASTGIAALVATLPAPSKSKPRAPDELTPDELTVLACLNELTGKTDLPLSAQFRTVSKELRDRLAEGATAGDCCAVLKWLRANRPAEWIAANLDQTTPFRPGTWGRNLTQGRAMALGATATTPKAGTATPAQAAAYDELGEPTE